MLSPQPRPPTTHISFSLALSLSFQVQLKTKIDTICSNLTLTLSGVVQIHGRNEKLHLCLESHPILLRTVSQLSPHSQQKSNSFSSLSPRSSKNLDSYLDKFHAHLQSISVKNTGTCYRLQTQSPPHLQHCSCQQYCPVLAKVISKPHC